MICSAVMASYYDKRSKASSTLTKYGLDRSYNTIHVGGVLTKGELFAALEAKGVTNVQMQNALELPSSRVSELRRGFPGSDTDLKPRELTYDEGVKLIQAFLPELDQQAPPLPVPILRLVVLHIARRLGCPVREEQVSDLAEDLRAFAEYASDPKVRGLPEAADGFFRALSLRR